MPEIGGPPMSGKTTLAIKVHDRVFESDSLRVMVFLRHGKRIRRGEPDHDLWQGWQKQHPRHKEWSIYNDEWDELRHEILSAGAWLISHNKEAPYILLPDDLYLRPSTDTSLSRIQALVHWLSTFERMGDQYMIRTIKEAEEIIRGEPHSFIPKWIMEYKAINLRPHV